jgi:hypothetical protein
MGSEFIEEFGATGGKCNAGSGSSELKGRALTEAAGGAGNDHHFSVEHVLEQKSPRLKCGFTGEFL